MDSTMLEGFRSRAAQLFRRAQQKLCNELEALEPEARFQSDIWTRSDSTIAHGGGGDTRVLRNGVVFEQAGVNFSEVAGTLPTEMSMKLVGASEELPFYATGVSIVIHPRSPLVPTTHANFRFLHVADQAWFGGGSDLTPYYLYTEDAKHFHQSIKDVCDRFDSGYYPRFKKWCDEYFYLPHRREARGVGGIFFDYCGKGDRESLEKYYQLVDALALALGSFYLPIVERRKDLPYTDDQRRFQLIRRGRYVEFNLLYDRGTLFGLKTNGRTESILMSLPPQVCWEYNFTPVAGSSEAQLIDVLQHPRAWV